VKAVITYVITLSETGLCFWPYSSKLNHSHSNNTEHDWKWTTEGPNQTQLYQTS